MGKVYGIMIIPAAPPLLVIDCFVPHSRRKHLTPNAFAHSLRSLTPSTTHQQFHPEVRAAKGSASYGTTGIQVEDVWDQHNGQNIGTMYMGGRRRRDKVGRRAPQSPSASSRDIDLFLCGLDEEEARAKIRHIHDVILGNCVQDPLVMVNGHAVTFYLEFPTRAIQVVSRLYRSPAEVLLGFDVDACCVGWDGTTVWMPPRTMRAFNTRCNVTDVTRRSLSYESRLYK